MKMFVFSVRDKAAEAFLPPMFFRSSGEAERAFVSAVRSPEHQFSKHVGDYSLYRLGSWDDASGLFVGVDPELILSGLQVGQSDQ